MTREQATNIVERLGVSSFDALLSTPDEIVGMVARIEYGDGHASSPELDDLRAAVEWLQRHTARSLAKRTDMTSETIRTTFDPRALPEWAQANRQIIDLCRRELSFRARVGEATTEQLQHLLVREARHAEADAWSLIGQAQRIQAQINFLYAARALGVPQAPVEMTVAEILEREG